jgi:hypothetical protein
MEVNMGAPFGQKGAVNVADAVASLALVRELLNSLQENGILQQEEIQSIVARAQASVPPGNNEGLNEARRLLREIGTI